MFVENGVKIDRINFKLELENKEVIELFIEKMSETQTSNSELKKCEICTQGRSDILAFYPCGHAVACEPCILRLFYQIPVKSKAQCPMCRLNVSDYLKLYY